MKKKFLGILVLVMFLVVANFQPFNSEALEMTPRPSSFQPDTFDM